MDQAAPTAQVAGVSAELRGFSEQSLLFVGLPPGTAVGISWDEAGERSWKRDFTDANGRVSLPFTKLPRSVRIGIEPPTKEEFLERQYGHDQFPAMPPAQDGESAPELDEWDGPWIDVPMPSLWKSRLRRWAPRCLRATGLCLGGLFILGLLGFAFGLFLLIAKRVGIPAADLAGALAIVWLLLSFVWWFALAPPIRRAKQYLASEPRFGALRLVTWATLGLSVTSMVAIALLASRPAWFGTASLDGGEVFFRPETFGCRAGDWQCLSSEQAARAEYRSFVLRCLLIPPAALTALLAIRRTGALEEHASVARRELELRQGPAADVQGASSALADDVRSLQRLRASFKWMVPLDRPEKEYSESVESYERRVLLCEVQANLLKRIHRASRR